MSDKDWYDGWIGDAKEKPEELISLAKDPNTKPTMLTFYLEFLPYADEKYYDEILELLKEGMRHDKAYVREGASIGLENMFADYEDIMIILLGMYRNETSEIIKGYLKEEIENYKEDIE